MTKKGSRCFYGRKVLKLRARVISSYKAKIGFLSRPIPRDNTSKPSLLRFQVALKCAESKFTNYKSKSH